MNVFDLISSITKLAKINDRCHKAIIKNRNPDEDDDVESMKIVDSILANIDETHHEELKYRLFSCRDDYKGKEIINDLIPLFR